jgi:tetratricopeptide (TPR) repeat protein
VLFNNIAQNICESLKLRILEDPKTVPSDSDILSQLNYSLTEINHNRGCIALEVNEPVTAMKHHLLFNQMMIRELADKPSHNDMRLAISWNELGNAYMLNNAWRKGQECFEKSIDEMKRLKTFEPIMVSLPLANLGLAYWLQGRILEADAILTRGLEDRERALGADDRISFM